RCCVRADVRCARAGAERRLRDRAEPLTGDGMSICRSSLLATLILAAPSLVLRTERHEPTGVASPAIIDSLRSLYIGRPAGWEHYELAPNGDGMKLTSDYDY